jgi:hypothetical protein
MVMACDLRSYAGADDTPLRLENLGADEVTWSGHSEALCKGRTVMSLKSASDRDNPDSPRSVSPGVAGTPLPVIFDACQSRSARNSDD